MSGVAARLELIRARVNAAAERAGRDPTTVRLLAVSKGQPSELLREAYAAGQRDFGENYVQELTRKAEELGDLPDLRLHMIGHLQRNKAKVVVRHAAAVLAGRGQRHAHDAAVGRVAGAVDEPFGLEPIEVVGQRRAGEEDAVGQFALRQVGLVADRLEEGPLRHRGAGGAELLVDPVTHGAERQVQLTTETFHRGRIIRDRMVRSRTIEQVVLRGGRWAGVCLDQGPV